MAARPQRILVGYDGSDASRRALDSAAQLVGYGSTLTVVSVAANSVNETAAALADAHEKLLRQHVTATYLRLSGNPADELVEAARALDADLVVVGRRADGEGAGRSASVSDAVVRRAPCDVLVVSRPPGG